MCALCVYVHVHVYVHHVLCVVCCVCARGYNVGVLFTSNSFSKCVCVHSMCSCDCVRGFVLCYVTICFSLSLALHHQRVDKYPLLLEKKEESERESDVLNTFANREYDGKLSRMCDLVLSPLPIPVFAR